MFLQNNMYAYIFNFSRKKCVRTDHKLVQDSVQTGRDNFLKILHTLVAPFWDFCCLDLFLPENKNIRGVKNTKYHLIYNIQKNNETKVELGFVKGPF